MKRDDVLGIYRELCQLDKASGFDIVENNQGKPIHNRQNGGTIIPHQFECGIGFDEKYEKNAKEGGQYVVRKDINDLLQLGENIGTLKKIGHPYLWDQDTVGIIDGYAKKAFTRRSDGSQIISLQENNKIDPNIDTTSQAWETFHNTAGFSCLYGGDQTMDLLLNSAKIYEQPPLAPTTKKYLALEFTVPDGYEIPHSRPGSGVIIPGIYRMGETDWIYNIGSVKANYRGYLLDHTPSYQRQMRSLQIKLSCWNDIYTNDSHKDQFITIFNEVSYWVSNKEERVYYCPFFPIGVGTYYVYFEYINGCASPMTHLWNHTTRPYILSDTFALYAVYRTLDFTEWKPPTQEEG